MAGPDSAGKLITRGADRQRICFRSDQLSVVSDQEAHYNFGVRELRIEITSFVDDHQPGIVECEFTDADGRQHKIIDKVPMFITAKDLERSSQYPQPATLRCAVLKTWSDENGRTVSQVDISNPDRLETTDGKSQFVVLESQLTSA